MIVADLDLEGITIDEAKANAPLVVDGNSVLSLPVLLESVQPIARGDPEIVETGRQVHVLQLAGRARGDVRGKRLAEPERKRSRVRRSANVLIMAQCSVSRDTRQYSMCRVTPSSAARALNRLRAQRAFNSALVCSSVTLGRRSTEVGRGQVRLSGSVLRHMSRSRLLARSRSVRGRAAYTHTITMLFLANALKEHHVGLEETADGVWSLYLGSVLLGKIDESTMKVYG